MRTPLAVRVADRGAARRGSLLAESALEVDGRLYDIRYRGAGADIPALFHEAVPDPPVTRVGSWGKVDVYGFMLDVAEHEFRWAGWTEPNLDKLLARGRPDVVGGGGGGGRYLWTWYDSRGVTVQRDPADEGQIVQWPRLIKDLAQRRSEEMLVATARDLAAAYHALWQAQKFWGKQPRRRWNDWSPRPLLTKLKADIRALGGDPALVNQPERRSA